MLNCQRPRALHRERSAYRTSPAHTITLIKQFFSVVLHHRPPPTFWKCSTSGGRRDGSASIYDVGRATTRPSTCFPCIPTQQRRSSCLRPTSFVFIASSSCCCCWVEVFVGCVLCVPWFLLDFYFRRWACFFLIYYYLWVCVCVYAGSWDARDACQTGPCCGHWRCCLRYK